jgi:hypothetical protein
MKGLIASGLQAAPVQAAEAEWPSQLHNRSNSHQIAGMGYNSLIERPFRDWRIWQGDAANSRQSNSRQTRVQSRNARP